VAAKPIGATSFVVEFTAHDLDDTIAFYRRISAQEARLAEVFDELVEHAPEYGRLPPGAQGPHSPTD
jgi:hypothetical protein